MLRGSWPADMDPELPCSMSSHDPWLFHGGLGPPQSQAAWVAAFLFHQADFIMWEQCMHLKAMNPQAVLMHCHTKTT